MLHTWIFFEITVNELLSGFSGDVQVLGQTIVADAIHNPKIDGLRLPAQIGSDVFRIFDAKYAHRGRGMDVLSFQEGFLQMLIPGNVRQHTQFDL
ncbi:hypothetical protein SDC9_56824 [bioreactor metagenome]|uniref:Uncharacterized protein n=1 Tax=bioreactor metagenome TaxID=1076179 RepID=A0A644X2W0_9ZZZZ